jgi:hypothetical protein
MSKELLDSSNSEASSPDGTDEFVSVGLSPGSPTSRTEVSQENQGSNDLHKPCRMALALEEW